MRLIFLVLSVFLFTSSADAEDKYFGAWKLSQFYGSCSLSLLSRDQSVKFLITSFGESIVTKVFLNSRTPHQSRILVQVSFIFEDGIESHLNGVKSYGKVSEVDEVSLGNNYNFGAMGRSKSMNMYIDGKQFAHFDLAGGKSAIDAWVECTVSAVKEYLN